MGICSEIATECTIGNMPHIPFQKCFFDTITYHCGYNQVNTLAYALIAFIFLYIIYKEFSKTGLTFTKGLTYAIIPFVLFGATARVVTDSIDTGAMQAFVDSGNILSPIYSLIMQTHIYDYSILTTSPGVYFVTAFLLLASIFILHRYGKLNLLPYVGITLWLPHLLILLPLIFASQFFPINIIYWILIIALTILSAAVAYYLFKKIGVDTFASFLVLSHALDGSATFVVIDLFGKITGKGYFEQHVVPNFIASLFEFTGFGFFFFFIVKVLFSFAAAYIIDKDAGTKNEKFFLFLVIIILGLAPASGAC